MGNLLTRKNRSGSSFGKQAESAFKEAVADAIEEHRIAGNPIAVLRGGEVASHTTRTDKTAFPKNQ